VSAYSAESYVDELNTHSSHIAWPQWKRDRLYSEIRRLISQRPGMRIRKRYLSMLHICRRRET